ncbi:hypothetical protein ZIOFF_073650 [Zingiber officinale]|uniref:FHA domain-containing protein n=1 Tax=Zingiber officinale TaxID=94328 RepID=A0A8J5C7G3_ZINOF|nr:hypothetical protein ZIOFF_073650 [Zingiber officinale]
MDCCDKLLSESGIIWSVLNAVYTKFSLIQGLEDAVDKLQRTQNSIQCLLIDAEALDIVNEAVKGWVCDMKTVAFDAENIIDEFQTLVDITKHAEAPSRRRKRSIPYLGGFMTLVKRRRIAEDIAKIEDRLDEIRKSRMNLGLEPSDGQRRSNGSNEMVCIPTSAKFDESRIFGRTKECDSVVAALKAKSVSNLHIVVIHDLPGIVFELQVFVDVNFVAVTALISLIDHHRLPISPISSTCTVALLSVSHSHRLQYLECPLAHAGNETAYRLCRYSLFVVLHFRIKPGSAPTHATRAAVYQEYRFSLKKLAH